MSIPRPDAEPSAGFDYADLGVDEDAARRLDLRKPSQLLTAKPPDPLVPGWIDRGELFLMVGKAWSGKSLFALDLACSVATGTPWLHRLQVCPGRVLYVVAEGRNSIAPRIGAWCRARGVHEAALEGSLFFAVGLADLGDAEWVKALRLITDQVVASLVVIDTLAQASPGKDENSARDMGVVIHAAQSLLLRPSRPAVGALHHHGKDQTKGARGSTAIPAACDVTFAISGPRGSVSLVSDKQRNHQTPEAVVAAIVDDPPYLQSRGWSLGEIIHAALAKLPNGIRYSERLTYVRIWASSALPPWRGVDAGPSREAVGKALENLCSTGIVNLTDGVYRVTPNTKEPPAVNFSV